MARGVFGRIAARIAANLAGFGEFTRFAARSLAMVFSPMHWRNVRLVLPQMYEVGVGSIPVVAITGAFIGMVLAVETFAQFQALGQETRLGAVINVAVVKQIGPVMAAVMLAGRVGGALTAELGTMRVTEQLDALRVMGSDPIRVLVVPRLLACVFLLPFLTIYSDVLGVAGGAFISVDMLGVPAEPYWENSARWVDLWDVNEGLIKSIFFGAAIALIACYKGFHCGAGANGVGRATTESFVASFVAIIVIDFFFAKVAKDWYTTLYGASNIMGGGG
jgi:phospholipid/cholesterol/gamma-HCH transport system permease protein